MRAIGAEKILRLLRSRYGSTSVAQQDVIKAEIEAATAEGDVVRRQGEQKSVRSASQCSDRRPSLAPLAAPTRFRAGKGIGSRGCRRWHAPRTQCWTGAQSNSAADQTKSLTDLNYYPDVTLGAKYVQRPGTEDSGEFMLGVKLPLQ